MNEDFKKSIANWTRNRRHIFFFLWWSELYKLSFCLFKLVNIRKFFEANKREAVSLWSFAFMSLHPSCLQFSKNWKKKKKKSPQKKSLKKDNKKSRKFLADFFKDFF